MISSTLLSAASRRSGGSAGGDAADIAAGRRHARSTCSATLSANFAAASTCSAASRFLSSASAARFLLGARGEAEPRRAPSPAPCRRASTRSISPPRRDRRAAARFAGRPRRFACDQPWPETFMKGPVPTPDKPARHGNAGSGGMFRGGSQAKHEPSHWALGESTLPDSTSSRVGPAEASRPLAHSRRSRCVWTRSMTRESASPMHGKSGSRTSRAARSSVTASSPQARPSRRPARRIVQRHIVERSHDPVRLAGRNQRRALFRRGQDQVVEVGVVLAMVRHRRASGRPGCASSGRPRGRRPRSRRRSARIASASSSWP